MHLGFLQAGVAWGNDRQQSIRLKGCPEAGVDLSIYGR